MTKDQFMAQAAYCQQHPAGCNPGCDDCPHQGTAQECADYIYGCVWHIDEHSKKLAGLGLTVEQAREWMAEADAAAGKEVPQ